MSDIDILLPIEDRSGFCERVKLEFMRMKGIARATWWPIARYDVSSNHRRAL